MVDSSATLHMMSKSDLLHEEKETNRKSKESCTILTANGTITAKEETTVYVNDLDMLITIQVNDNSALVHSLGKNTAKTFGHSYKWREHNNPH